MPGLLADVNLQGHLAYLEQRLVELDLFKILTNDLGIEFATFTQLGLDRALDDRKLWSFCQQHRWILFTDNRNCEDETSLQATLDQLWHVGMLPIVTLANKNTFENNAAYAAQVAEEIAEILFSTFHANVCDLPRIFVPRYWHSKKRQI